MILNETGCDIYAVFYIFSQFRSLCRNLFSLLHLNLKKATKSTSIQYYKTVKHQYSIKWGVLVKLA